MVYRDTGEKTIISKSGEMIESGLTGTEVWFGYASGANWLEGLSNTPKFIKNYYPEVFAWCNKLDEDAFNWCYTDSTPTESIDGMKGIRFEELSLALGAEFRDKDITLQFKLKFGHSR
jgi:hypothetical protein